MLISVIIPVFSNPHLLPRALHSIPKDGLRSSLEVVVVNDGIGERCRSRIALLEEFPHWIYVENQNNGASAARNRAISVARGEWIVPLDDDDQLCEDYLRKVAKIALEGESNVNMVVPRIRIIGSDSARLWGGEEWSTELIKEKNLFPYCSAFTKELWQSVGGYRESLRGYEDWDLWLRARHEIRPQLLDEVGLTYHRSATGLLTAVQDKDLELRAQLFMGSPEGYRDSEVRAARAILAGEYSGEDVPRDGIFGRSRVIRELRDSKA